MNKGIRAEDIAATYDVNATDRIIYAPLVVLTDSANRFPLYVTAAEIGEILKLGGGGTRCGDAPTPSCVAESRKR